MSTTTLDELEWIHDCQLISVHYEGFQRGEVGIQIVVRCPNDLGYERWDGKIITITAVDVAACRQSLLAIGVSETVDAVRPGISSALRESTSDGRRMGIRFPELEFTVAFVSGSAIELICREVIATPA